MSSTTFSTTPTTDRPWVHEMVVIHRVFRREFTLLPRLIREVADGDTGRAEPVAQALRSSTSTRAPSRPTGRPAGAPPTDSPSVSVV